MTNQSKDQTKTAEDLEDAVETNENPNSDGSDNSPDQGNAEPRNHGSSGETDDAEKAEVEPDVHAMCAIRISRLEHQLREREKQVDETLRAYRNIDEEFRKAKERLAREQEREIQRQKSRIIAAFFEVADNLERSFVFAEPGISVNTLTDGMRMVHSQFMNTLVELGLSTIAPEVGTPFNPDIHDAVGVAPASEPAQHQTVFQLLRNGYRAGDTLLRPAMVIVGQYTEK